MASKVQNFEIEPKYMAALAVALLVLFVSLKSFTKIDPNERGVVLRLGRFEPPLLEPGPHFVIPFVDEVEVIETEVIHKEEFGYRSSDGKDRTQYQKGIYKESLMVTGDLNMAEVEWSVQYKIEDPYHYLFSVNDPVKTLRDLSNSVMSQVVGDHSVYEALTVGRGDIEMEAQVLLQQVIRQYNMGIKILALKLQNVLPPEKVQASYNEVNEAEQYRERLINEAQRQRNSVVPKARGEAKQRMEQAEGYKVNRVNRATGDAERFVALYEAYKIAPDVTRKRLYLETMSQVLEQIDEVILVDEDQKGLLPLIDLTKEAKKQ